MPVRIADSMKQMNDLNSFPVAYGSDIWLDKNMGVGTADYSDLQTMYNNSELGDGGSSIQVDTMPIASAENENMIVEYVGASGTYQNGYFYQNIGSGDPKVYSWVQKNVQPSNATATDVSYDNTTSELVATNVQDAIDEIKGGLGTASGKNFTDLVRPNSHELVESGSVYSAINNALSSIYTPRGELTCAELTSSLLIEDNVGNIYTMNDSGTTSALFINGAGLTINIGDNVGIIKAGANTYLFNYMGNAFDLTDYQKKDLSSPIAGASTVEGAIAQNTSDIEKIKAYTAVSNTDANTLTTTGLYYLTTGCTNIPSAYCILQVQSKNTTSISDDIAQYTVNTEGNQYSRVRVNGTWSSWRKLATSDDMTSLLKNKMSCYTWGTDKTLKAVFYEITDRGILPDVTDAVGKRIIARYGNVLINRITQVNGVKNLYWDDTLVLSCPWNDDTTKLVDVLEIFVGTTSWQKFVTDEIVPSDASASNKLVAESDTNSAILTSTDSLASWTGNAKGVMTAFIGTSSKPSDIGAPLSSWGETMIWCIGHNIRKTLFAIDYSVTQQVIYTREYFNGSFITNWTAIKDGNLTSSVISGSTAPITSGALYPVAITTPTPVSGVTGGDDLIYGFKSGKMVTIVLNGIIMANNITQNKSIFTNVPTAVGNKNIYFTVLDYENGKLAVMSIIGDSLAAAFQSDDKSAVHAGRYWGTVTYMTSD